jgi:hypothetical protein
MGEIHSADDRHHDVEPALIDVIEGHFVDVQAAMRPLALACC